MVKKKAKVEWYKLVWFSLVIPQHVFFLWLAILDGLGTGDRLMKWGVAGDMRCYFC